MHSPNPNSTAMFDKDDGGDHFDASTAESRYVDGVPSLFGSDANSDARSVKLELSITDPETASSLISHPVGRQRDEFARQALRIGVLALRQAQGLVDGERVRNEGERLISELTGRLTQFQSQADQALTSTLREYFDPSSGRFAERVESLVRADGDLSRVMQTELSRMQTALSHTLALHIGDDSALLRMLSPGDDNALLSSLKSQVEHTVAQRADLIVKEFSLDNPQGALSRLLREVTEKHGNMQQCLQERINELVGEFSLDNADSALSRLLQQVDTAQRRLSAEFSLDTENSALARLKREVLTAMDEQGKRNNEFQAAVTGLLEGMKARKQEAARSTQHGNEFEAVGVEVLTRLLGNTGDLVDACGDTTGLIDRCKIGDLTVTLGAESAMPGSRIVAEFKQDASYTVAKALDEIEKARKNRDAEIGIFVFSRRTAPQGISVLQRYGNDILMVWDSEDESTDALLNAAVSVGKALIVKSRASADDSAKLDELTEAVLGVEKQTERLDGIRKSATTIKNSADKIFSEAENMEKDLTRRILTMNTYVAAVKVGGA